jgi:hydroxymethylpyrimidine/phosphomethylpyrimidine kinase
MKSAAKAIAGLGPAHVLLKGGHSSRHPGTDILYPSTQNNFLVLEGRAFATRNNHGTGCTLSSAVAAYLARGLSVTEAVRSAKAYIGKAISAGAAYRIGNGHGPVHHFFDYWS